MSTKMTYSELYSRTIRGARACVILQKKCWSCPYAQNPDCIDELDKDILKMEDIMKALDELNIEIGRF